VRRQVVADGEEDGLKVVLLEFVAMFLVHKYVCGVSGRQQNAANAASGWSSRYPSVSFSGS
jgi:hypothetical protein